MCVPHTYFAYHTYVSALLKNDPEASPGANNPSGSLAAEPSHREESGGAERDRTADLLRARQALSQLSYSPAAVASAVITGTGAVVGLGGLEPPTSPLSGVRSNHLSYRPSPAHKRAPRLTSLPAFVHDQTIGVDACASKSSGSAFKEVIQPQVPLRLPCYDFTPVIGHTVVSAPLAVKLPTSGAVNSHGVTGGVYKARERIHRDILIRDY